MTSSKKTRIAFFGTPEFAVPVFQGLLNYCAQHDCTLAFVVCQPDRPKGRGQRESAPAVKVLAEQYHVTALQPKSLKVGADDGDALRDAFRQEPIDLAVVVAYGRIIPADLLRMSRCGFVNVHASLLPRWRGAAPIQRALEAGDAKTGVSIMDLVPELDAGDVYLTREIGIAESDDAMSLAKKLSALGTSALIDCLPRILDGTLEKSAQPIDGITYAKMLSKEEGEVDFAQSARTIVNRYRGFQPWPGLFTSHNGRTIRLFAVRQSRDDTPKSAPGTIVRVDDFLVVQTGDGCVQIGELQLEGKKRLPVAAFLNGYPLIVGEHIGKI